MTRTREATTTKCNIQTVKVALQEQRIQEDNGAQVPSLLDIVSFHPVESPRNLYKMSSTRKRQKVLHCQVQPSSHALVVAFLSRCGVTTN
jgi:hypothetical protein